MDEQLAYFDAVMKHLERIVPPEKRHLYHLIFGSSIIDSFPTAKEMEDADKNKYEGLVCVRYYPYIYSATRIQALWRGHHSRHSAMAA